MKELMMKELNSIEHHHQYLVNNLNNQIKNYLIKIQLIQIRIDHVYVVNQQLVSKHQM